MNKAGAFSNPNGFRPNPLKAASRLGLGPLMLRVGLRQITGDVTGRMHKIPRIYRGPYGFTGKITPGDVLVLFCPELAGVISTHPGLPASMPGSQKASQPCARESHVHCAARPMRVKGATEFDSVRLS